MELFSKVGKQRIMPIQVKVLAAQMVAKIGFTFKMTMLILMIIKIIV